MISTIVELYNHINMIDCTKIDLVYLSRYRGIAYVAVFGKHKIRVSDNLYSILYNRFNYLDGGMFDSIDLSKMIIELRNKKLEKII